MRGKHGMHATASRQARWKPGGSVASNGYVKIRVGKGHPLADSNGYAYEHLVVWCSAGRARPPKGWLLHHLNHDKTDNRLGNLELKPRSAHSVAHQRRALTDGEVAALRYDYAAGHHTGILSKKYGVPAQRAWKLVRGMSRRSAGGPIVEDPIRKRSVEHNGVPEVCHG